MSARQLIPEIQSAFVPLTARELTELLRIVRSGSPLYLKLADAFQRGVQRDLGGFRRELRRISRIVERTKKGGKK
jgi:hypothetical protein